MPFVIRDTKTGEIMKMRSGKSVWSQASHAKAAFSTSGCYIRNDAGTLEMWGGYYGKRMTFAEQDRLEVVEAKIETAKPSDAMGKALMKLAKAEELLAGVASFLEDVHAGESEIAEEIRAYFKEVK